MELGASSAQQRHVEVDFDYSAAETVLRVLESSSPTQEQIAAAIENRGVAATVRKMQVFFPPGNKQGYDASEAGFKRALHDAAANRPGPPGVFKLSSVRTHRRQVENLLQRIRAGESAIKKRMSAVLDRYAPAGIPARITVNFVVGGSSDGFVIDADPIPELFVAVDKAEGDEDGLEYNIDHELYHVLQKSSGMRSKDYARFVSRFEDEPPLEKLFATTLWEGSATFVVDARSVPGTGPYMSMWRDRYIANESDQRRGENFALFDELVAELDRGAIRWPDAYAKGFSDERLYHVGRELTRALVAARGSGYMDELFTRPPVQFFRDYIALCSQNSALVPFAARTRAIIRAAAPGW